MNHMALSNPSSVGGHSMANDGPKQLALQRQARMVLQGEYLAEKRRAAGLTQLEVAQALGFPSDTMIGNYERGRCWVNTKHQKALAEVLGVPTALFSFKMLTYRDPEAAKMQINLMSPDVVGNFALVDDIRATVRKVGRVVEAVKRNA